MIEAITINNEELAIWCDIVSGWGLKKIGRKSGCIQTTGT